MTATVLCATKVPEIAPRIVSEPTREGNFLVGSALLFAASVALTVLWCASMSSMGAMPMPGGWSMSMVWTRMPEQTWAGASVSFLGMWVAMMVVMMLPSLVPMLQRYRQAIGCAGWTLLDRRTALVGAGYFFVWIVLGMAVFPLGAALATLVMRLPALARAVPITVSAIVLISGALQFTTWKAHHLACSREPMDHDLALLSDTAGAWKHGLRLGLHCACCCAGFTAILIAIGIMDLRTMAVVTTAITVERFAPAGQRAAQAIGIVIVGAGLLLIARAAGLG